MGRPRRAKERVAVKPKAYDISKQKIIIYKEKSRTTTTLTVKGPLSPEEGSDLAIQLNGLIAQFNTLFFLVNGQWKPGGKITAQTGQPV